VPERTPNPIAGATPLSSRCGVAHTLLDDLFYNLPVLRECKDCVTKADTDGSATSRVPFGGYKHNKSPLFRRAGSFLIASLSVLLPTLLAQFLPAFLSVNEHVIGVSDPLLLCLPDFAEPAPIIQLNGVHRF
jgi:hypothetical protein